MAAAYAPASTFGLQPTDATPNWGVPAFLKATIATAMAFSSPAQGTPQQAQVKPQPAAAFERGIGTTAPGGIINYGSRGLGSASGLSHNSVEMARIHEFMLARPAADLGAIEQIHLLAARSFTTAAGPLPLIDYRVEDEPEGPALFLSVDTQGMDFDEQMQREQAMRQAIWDDARLLVAKKYMVISVY